MALEAYTTPETILVQFPITSNPNHVLIDVKNKGSFKVALFNKKANENLTVDTMLGKLTGWSGKSDCIAGTLFGIKSGCQLVVPGGREALPVTDKELNDALGGTAKVTAIVTDSTATTTTTGSGDTSAVKSQTTGAAKVFVALLNELNTSVQGIIEDTTASDELISAATTVKGALDTKKAGFISKYQELIAAVGGTGTISDVKKLAGEVEDIYMKDTTVVGAITAAAGTGTEHTVDSVRKEIFGPIMEAIKAIKALKD